MTIELVPDSTKMWIDNKGVATKILAGTRGVLLHNNVNYIDFAVDQDEPVGLSNGPAVRFSGTVFLKADPKKDRAELEGWRFGFIQVANIMVYSFRYSGRVRGEGSISIDIKRVFAPNPCLDGDFSAGKADPAISVSKVPVITAIAAPFPGFKIDVTCVDNPMTIVKGRYENGLTAATNYLYEARRDEGFITCLAARAPNGTLTLLASSRWKLTWHGQFKWKTGVEKPLVTDLSSKAIFAPVAIGDPGNDPLVAMARNPTGQHANDLDAAAWARVKARDGEVFDIKRDPLPDLPADFYT